MRLEHVGKSADPTSVYLATLQQTLALLPGDIVDEFDDQP
jgi:hypothetical protein